MIDKWTQHQTKDKVKDSGKPYFYTCFSSFFLLNLTGKRDAARQLNTSTLNTGSFKPNLFYHHKKLINTRINHHANQSDQKGSIVSFKHYLDIDRMQE